MNETDEVILWKALFFSVIPCAFLLSIFATYVYFTPLDKTNLHLAKEKRDAVQGRLQALRGDIGELKRGINELHTRIAKAEDAQTEEYDYAGDSVYENYAEVNDVYHVLSGRDSDTDYRPAGMSQAQFEEAQRRAAEQRAAVELLDPDHDGDINNW